MSGLIALFLSLLPSKSTPTKTLIAFFSTAVLLSLGYVLVQGFYFPSKWSRVYLLVAITFNHVLVSQIFFHFPLNTHPKLAKGFFYGQSLVFLLVDIFLIWKSIDADVIYDFGGHYFEVNAQLALKVYGGVILVNILVVAVIAIWKIIITKSRFLLHWVCS